MPAIEKLTASWYTLEGTDEEYELKPLDGIGIGKVQAGVTVREDGSAVFSADACFDALMLGLINWRNVKDSNGVVEFSNIMRENISRLDWPTVRELALEIISRSTISSKDKKKSS